MHQDRLSAVVSFVNGSNAGSGAESLRIAGPDIVAVNATPDRDDLLVDLRGDRLLPGLINAHDHLQLNTLPAVEPGTRRRHALEWISEINRRRGTDTEFEARVAVAQQDRLLIGGIKNLLSGVTTVAHHDPLFPTLRDPNFPVRVVANYGWSHSLYVDSAEDVGISYRNTPAGSPWIIHAAEGVDEVAADEFDRLEALGCLGPNTLIVHGIALDSARRRRLESVGAGLVWCPASNLRLFGTTAEVADLLGCGRVALGSDSRLTGARDLLEELRVAREDSGFDESTLESLVTVNSATLLHLPDCGSLRPGARADFMILPAGMLLSDATRSDVRLVVVGGVPRYADEYYANRLAAATYWAPVLVDGTARMLERGLAMALSQAKASEPGLELTNLSWRAA